MTEINSSERGRAEMARAKRNLRPTPEAVAAMWLWGKRYSKQRGGSMDFWDGLSESEKRLARNCVEQILAAHTAHA